MHRRIVRLKPDRGYFENPVYISYTQKIYNASTIHLGVFRLNELVGVLQLGYAMNPQSMAGVVADTRADEYLELNRMWIDDSAPRNSESRAIAFAVSYIRRAHRRVAWIQSFADERCRRFGVVYQAANFLYVGEHTSTFWELDGEWYHDILMTCTPDRGKGSAYLQANRDRAIAHRLRQFRYILFLKPRFRRSLLLKVQPYPKHAP